MSADKQEVYFSLAISADEFKRYYHGTGRVVLVQAWDGRTLQFPAGSLTRFIGHDGVFGDFVICYDERHKLVSLERVDQR